MLGHGPSEIAKSIKYTNGRVNNPFGVFFYVI
jgi:beta-N-acetylglucosaminidase